MEHTDSNSGKISESNSQRNSQRNPQKTLKENSQENLSKNLEKTLNWNQIYLFSEVAACNSFKNAGKKLQLSPSTLSEHISQLEKNLNVRLFHRHHRTISLTEEGSRLYMHAKEMFEVGQRLVQVVSSVTPGSYPITVGLVPSPAMELAYQVIGDFLKKHGPLSLKISHADHADLETNLARAQYDFGFSHWPTERKDLSCQLISSSSIGFYVSKKFKDCSLQELLKTLPLLVCSAESTSRKLVERHLNESELTPCHYVFSEFPAILLNLREKGLGIGVFGKDFVDCMNMQNLRAVPTPKGIQELKEELYVLWAKDANNTDAVKRLQAILSK